MLNEQKAPITRVRPGVIIGLGEFGREVIHQFVGRLKTLHGDSRLPFLSYLSIGASTSTVLAEHEQLELKGHRFPPGDFPGWYPGLAADRVPPTRIQGRARLREHFAALRRSLQQAEGRCRDSSALDLISFVDSQWQVRVELDHPTSIYLFTDLQPLNSGIAADVGFLIKEVFGAHRSSLNAWLVLPDSEGEVTYESRRDRAHVYAFLKELEAQSAGEEVRLDWLPGPLIKGSPPPFDNCFVTAPREGLAAELAEQVLQDFLPGPLAEYRRSTRVNLRQFVGREIEYGSGLWSQNFTCRFGSTQLATMGLPHRVMIETCSLQLAAELVQLWSGKPEAKTNETQLQKLLEKHRPLISGEEILKGLADPDGGGDPQKGTDSGLERLLLDHQKVLREHARGERIRVESLVERTRKLTEDITSPEGSVARAITANRLALESLITERLDRLVQKLTISENLSLEETLRVLQRLSDQTINLRKQIAVELRKVGDALAKSTRIAQQCLVELASGSPRKKWPWGKSRTESVLETYSQAVLSSSAESPGSAQCLLRERILKAAGELVEALRVHLVGHSKLRGLHDSLKERLESSKAVLERWGDEIEALKATLLEGARTHLCVTLGEMETSQSLYQAYRPTEQQLLTLSQQILRHLNTTLLELPQAEADPTLWTPMCEEPFLPLRHDYHALRQFFEQTPEVQRAQVQNLISRCTPRMDKAHPLLQGRTFDEQKHFIVALPSSTGRSVNETSQLRAYAERFQKLVLSFAGGEANFVEMPGTSEFIFQTESSGLPLTLLVELDAYRTDYELFLSAGEPLHLDSRVEELSDIAVFSEEDQRATEQAFRAFVLGQLLGVVESRKGQFFWNFRKGLLKKAFPLGPASRALAKLRRDPRQRGRLTRTVDDRLNAIHSLEDLDSLARFAYALARAKDQVFGVDLGVVADESELPLGKRMELQVIKLEERRLFQLPPFRQLEERELSEILEGLRRQESLFLTRDESGRLVFKPALMRH